MNNSSITQRTQTVTMQIPAGTALGTILEINTPLDQAYRKCKGFAIYITSNAGNTDIDLGVRKDSGQILDMVNHRHCTNNNAALPTNNPIEPNKRFFDADFVADGQKIICQARPYANVPAGGIVVQFVFLLKNE